jgi:hypothetical protein
LLAQLATAGFRPPPAMNVPDLNVPGPNVSPRGPIPADVIARGGWIGGGV